MGVWIQQSRLSTAQLRYEVPPCYGSSVVAAGASHRCDAPCAVFAAQELVFDVQLGSSGSGDGELRFELLEPFAQASGLGSLLGEDAPQRLDLPVARLSAIDAARPFLEDSRSAVERGSRPRTLRPLRSGHRNLRGKNLQRGTPAPQEDPHHIHREMSVVQLSTSRTSRSTTAAGASPGPPPRTP